MKYVASELLAHFNFIDISEKNNKIGIGALLKISAIFYPLDDSWRIMCAANVIDDRLGQEQLVPTIILSDYRSHVSPPAI